jgi:hypothetical protein
MLKTKQLILACIVLALGLAVGFVLTQIFKTQNYPVAGPWDPGDRKTLSAQMVSELKRTVSEIITEKTGEPVVGVEPELLLTHFSNLAIVDFDGVEANVGQYLVADNQIQYNNTEVSDAAADDISDAGFKTLFTNYYTRNSLSIKTPLADVVASLQIVATSTQNNGDENTDDFVACTMDAMQCPDGSYVGRTGPDCTFSCPTTDEPAPQEVVCTQEQKDSDVCIEIYAPVCAQVQVECVTTPCNPVPQTFPNGCFACSEDRVISYVDGSCDGGELTTE